MTEQSYKVRFIYILFYYIFFIKFTNDCGGSEL